MANSVVGTAYVRLRLLTDQLSSDIKSSVENSDTGGSVSAATKDLEGLSQKLDEVARKSPDIRITSNADMTTAQMAALQAAEDRVTSSHERAASAQMRLNEVMSQGSAEEIQIQSVKNVLTRTQNTLNDMMDKGTASAQELEKAQENVTKAEKSLSDVMSVGAASERQKLDATNALAAAERAENTSALSLAAVRERINTAMEKAVIDENKLTDSTNKLSTATKDAGTKAKDAASGGFSPLLATIVALGPAVVPLGAVAVAALGAATVAAGTALLAFQGVKLQMAQGTATGVAFSQGLGVLTGDLHTLETTASNNVLGAFQDSIENVNAQMPALNKEVGNFAAIGGDIGSHVLNGLIGGFHTLEPLFTTIMIDADKLAASFDKYANGGGLAKFQAWTMANLPAIGKDLGAVAVALGQVTAAMGPFGLSSLNTLGLVARAIDAIPLPVLQKLIPLLAEGYLGFQAWKIASSIIDGVSKSIQGFTEWQAALAAKELESSAAATSTVASSTAAAAAIDAEQFSTQRLTEAMAQLRLAQVSATLANEQLAVSSVETGAAQAAQAGESKLAGVGDALTGIANSGAVAGLALGAVAVVAAVAADKIGTAVLQSKELNYELGTDLGWKALAKNTQDFTTAFEQSKGAVDSNIQSMTASNLQASGLADKAAKAGISLTQLTAGVTGNDKAFQSLVNTWKSSGAPNDKTLSALNALRLAFDQGKISAAQYSTTMADLIAKSHGNAQTMWSDAKVSAQAMSTIANQLGLTDQQSQKYAATVGITAEAIQSGSVSERQYYAAVAEVRTIESQASQSTDLLTKAMGTFSASAGGAADRAALLGAYLVNSQGDMLLYLGAMADATTANQKLVEAFETQATQIKKNQLDWSESEAGALKFTYAQGKLTDTTIDYNKAGAGPLIQQLQAIQTGAEKAAEATYQHDLATKSAKDATIDATNVFNHMTNEVLAGEAKALGISDDQAKGLANTFFHMGDQTAAAQIGLGDINTTLEKLGQQLAHLTHVPWDIQVGFALNNDVGKLVHDAVNNIGPVVVPVQTVSNALIPHADGGVSFYAGGGENHVAQIAAAGANRLWAEPETGGEAYIPLSLSKRARSLGILSTVAAQFGYQLASPGGTSALYSAYSSAPTGGSSNAAQSGLDAMTVARMLADRPIQLVVDGRVLATSVNNANLRNQRIAVSR